MKKSRDRGPSEEQKIIIKLAPEEEALTVLPRDQQGDRGAAWGGREGDQRETTHAKGMGRELSGDYSPAGKFGANRNHIF